MKEDTKLAEERFYELMKRVRKLGLDTYPQENKTVSLSQMAFLDYIAGLPGCGVHDIASGMQLTPPTVSVSVRKMEANQLLERKPDPIDGRAVKLFLTRRGQTLQRRIKAYLTQKFRRLLAGLSPQEQDMLLQLLEKALQVAEAEKSITE